VRWLTLYLRSRRVPAALAGAAGCTVVMWTLWSMASDSRTAGPELLVLTVLLLVASLAATLAGPDDALDGTAAPSWPARRVAHLLGAFVVVLALLAGTLLTGARFAPVGTVVRDTAGLLGLTALGAAVLGAARSWFLPLGWTLAAILFPRAQPLVGEILTWQAQPPSSRPAAVTAGVLALAGLVGYAVAGPARRAPAEAAQR
jgi:hypothetical protein